MKILLVSGEWPIKNRAGVSLSALLHTELLIKAGHDVFILGAIPEVANIPLSVKKKYYVKSIGTGSIYSPAVVKKSDIEKVLLDCCPDLVIVEGWQHSLNDAVILQAHKLNLKLLLISHGVSVLPLRNSFFYWIRSLAWLKYILINLIFRIRYLDAITTLSLNSVSNRFFDRFLALKYNIPCFYLSNRAIHLPDNYIEFDSRLEQIVFIGYFSYIKNQIDALKILKLLPKNIRIKFIGQRTGSYYDKCVSYTIKHGLFDRVVFSEDHECDIAKELSNSKLILITSITEAQPIVAIEAMACGTPIVSYDIGAMRDINSAIICANMNQAVSKIADLFLDEKKWQKYSSELLSEYSYKYTNKDLDKSFFLIVDQVLNK